MSFDPEQLVDDYLDDELDDAASEQLRAWLEADPKNVRSFVRQVFLHRQLRDSLLAESVARELEAKGDLLDGSPVALRPTERQSERAFAWSYATLAMLLLVGAILGSAATWQVASRFGQRRSGDFVALDPKRGPSSDQARNVATLVNVTNCRWDQNRSTAQLALGGTVRPGDSLHLLEGVAEISSTLQNGGMANLQLEGPVAMTLNANGMPSLLYGHLTGTFACDFDEFTLDTPLGLVAVSGEASIGIIATANKVELHVFSGTATLEPWAIGVGRAVKPLTAAAGTSLSARVDADGAISVDDGTAKESGFLTPAALAASQLDISEDYVKTIVAAQPLAYWRFEGDVDGLMRNEIADRLHCRMVGKAVRWHPGANGSSVEFGIAAGPGYLISDDTLDVESESYSVELWAKPTCFHHGTLFSLLQWKEPQSPIGRHRMALEICGPVSWFTGTRQGTDFHPGSIRFIHECRPGFDMDSFSANPYAVRQWQHFVAVKASSEMRLYCDGRLVDSKQASGALPRDLRVLIGHLLPASSEDNIEVTPRMFSGELDEVAYYDRALAPDEIRQHFELVRPLSNP
jgi:hypothetical protein